MTEHSTIDYFNKNLKVLKSPEQLYIKDDMLLRRHPSKHWNQLSGNSHLETFWWLPKERRLQSPIWKQLIFPFKFEPAPWKFKSARKLLNWMAVLPHCKRDLNKQKSLRKEAEAFPSVSRQYAGEITVITSFGSCLLVISVFNT